MLTTDILAKLHALDAPTALGKVRALAGVYDMDPQEQCDKYMTLRIQHDRATIAKRLTERLGEAWLGDVFHSETGEDVTDDLVAALNTGMAISVVLAETGPVLKVLHGVNAKPARTVAVRQGAYAYTFQGAPLNTGGVSMNEWLRENFPNSKAVALLNAAKNSPGKTDFWNVTRRDPELRNLIARTPIA